MKTGQYQIIVGSAHDLKAIDDKKVQCIATSPPYYGLRSYSGDQDIEWPTVTYRLNEWCEPITVQGYDPKCRHEWSDLLPDHHPGQVEQTKWKNAKAAGHGQTSGSGRYCVHCGGWRGPLGLEPSPVAYIGHLILCLREWRRVLRDDGVCFVNLGDSYSGSGGAGGDYNSGGLRDGQPRYKGNKDSALKPKDMVGIPWMFAFAARADGWWLRSDVIWAKPNPMPESVMDRPTKAHEYIFLLTKRARYYFDADAVREESNTESGWYKQREKGQGAGSRIYGNNHDDGMTLRNDADRVLTNSSGRNIRTVWDIATQPYSGAHFATMPTEIPRRCIRAATSERGCCPACGAPWRRVVERRQLPFVANSEIDRYGNGKAGVHRKVGGQYQKWLNANPPTTTGWQPTCECFGHFEKHKVQRSVAAKQSGKHDVVKVYVPDGEQPEPIPCTVLDPFGGSGTTAIAACNLGRDAIINEISDEYAELAKDRISSEVGAKKRQRKQVKKTEINDDYVQPPMFDASLLGV